MGVMKKTAPQRAGARCDDIDGATALRLIGDDPASMLLAIELMDRLLAKRRPRRRTRRRQDSY